MNEKIGIYTEDEILEHLTEGEGRGFLGRSMYDAIFDKIHALKTENEQLKKQVENYKKLGFKYLLDKNNNLENQQKEFINYLEDMLDNENDIFSVVRVKDVLQKYKEIIGVSDENSKN